MGTIDIYVGTNARRHIEQNGLQPEHIETVFGASGAAKWLAIYGLDQAILNHWLPRSDRPVKVFGTSVGAFKFAAACHKDGEQGMEDLAQGYINQYYPNGDIGPDAIEREFQVITDTVINDARIGEILSHPKYRFSCGVVRCHGGLAQPSQTRQKLASVAAALKNVGGRKGLIKALDRVVFTDPREQFPIAGHDGYRTEQVELHQNNFKDAIMASGSIPVYMHGIKDIQGAGPGMYRDGGLLDYHPVPGNLWDGDELILYPHFYPHCKEGWFDKLHPKRKAAAELMRNVIMISPSQEFLESTQLKRIPDRKDFVTYANDNDTRLRLWQEITDRSKRMGEEFLELAEHQNWAPVLKDI